MAVVQESIQLHYKDLIDMALGSTDIGLFNLHLLHTILRCLVVHLNLDETTIEYNGTQRGNIEFFFANRASVAKQTIIEKVAIEASNEEQVTPQVNLVVKDHNKEEDPCGNPGTPGKMVSRSLPKCKDIITALKCNTDPKENPLGKMVDLINLSERMTAAEIAIEKLSSLICHLTKKNQELTDLLEDRNRQIASVKRLSGTEVNEAGTGGSRAGASAGGAEDESTEGTGDESPSSGRGGVAVDGADGKGSTVVVGGDTGLGGDVGTGVGADGEKGGAGVSGPDGAGVSGQGGAGVSGQGGAGVSGQGGAGVSGQGSAGVSGQVGAGVSGQGGAGVSGQVGAGVSGQVGAGVSGQGEAGVSGQGEAGVRGQGGTGVSGQGGAGISGQGGAGISGQGAAVVNGQDSAGGGGVGAEGGLDGKSGIGIDGISIHGAGVGAGSHRGSGGIGTVSHGSAAAGKTGLLKDDSVVAIYVRPPSQKLETLSDEKKDQLFKDFQDMFICSGGIATGKMLKHAERDLLRKLHLFKSMVFERLIALECDLSGTQKEVKHINDNVEDLLDGFGRLSKKIDHFDQFEKSSIEQFLMIQKNIHCLMGEREVRRRQIYDILESIEMLKTIKANKEDLDLLAEQKADKFYADSKVSIKKFNIIQNDLACSIIQTMEKNSAQDIDMANAVKRIESVMEGKIDKSEHNYKMATLGKRIDEVSDKLNEMIKLRVCPEGAGTIQILKNVRCITCNDVVQMKMDEKNALPSTAVLKTKRQFAMQVETECRAGTKPKLTEIIRSRYCGGEYTTMEPNEKVPQKTDFYIDANVCPPPMADVYYIEGNDGALYRAQAPQCPFENTNSSHLIKRKPSK